MLLKQKLIDYYRRYWPYVHELRDVRVLGMMAFAVVVLLVSWSGVKTINTNYQLQKQITALQQQNELQTLANQNLELQNQYYQSNQYLELNSRQNFGLAAPGETELLVPKSVALAHILPLRLETKKPASARVSGWQKNFRAWADFFLHRPQSDGE